MSNILVVNAAGHETRVALVESGIISEYYIERKREKGIVGNIYKGRVVRVLPGMQAAFVDIGLEKAGFLYVGDVTGTPDLSEEFELAETPEGEHADVEASDAPPPDENAPDIEPTAAPVHEESVGLAVELTPSEPSAPVPSEPEAPVAAAAPAEPPPSEPAPEIAPPPVVAELPIAGVIEAAPPAQAAAEVRETTRPAQPIEKREKRHRRDRPQRSFQKRAQIQDLLKEGDEVMVQVAKDPIGTKGARITCHISLPGRHLVFMPTVDHVGISRRIENEKERRRLRELVDDVRPAGTGFIVRTVAENVSREKLIADIKFLLNLWQDIHKKSESKRGPTLLHPDLDLILRSVRDLFSADVEKLVIDDRKEYERVTRFLEQAAPQLTAHVEFHDGEEAIFDAYGIEQEINRALSRKVWLKSGGYIIIDQAEALTAIDVNSGRYVGKKDLEETITRINVEAAREVVYQLRLRNIGGIIIIDFIDMDKSSNREKVFKSLQDALGHDRAKTNVLKISELGLVEMTRKRVRESVGRMLHEPCANCEGKGYVKSKITVAYEIFREIQRQANNYREDSLVVNCHPEVAKLLTIEEKDTLRLYMDKFNKGVNVRPQSNYHQEQFDIYGKWSRKLEKPAAGEGQVEVAAAKPS